MTAAETFAAVAERIDWNRWTRGFFGPLGALRQSVATLDSNLTVAATHPCDAVRSVRLEMAERELAAIRSTADELELAISQAREALGRADV